jgi:hypothetical protein
MICGELPLTMGMFSRAQILGVDRWFHPCVAFHVPADVDLEAGVRRVRAVHRPPQVLLRTHGRRRQRTPRYRRNLPCPFMSSPDPRFLFFPSVCAPRAQGDLNAEFHTLQNPRVAPYLYVFLYYPLSSFASLSEDLFLLSVHGAGYLFCEFNKSAKVSQEL